MSRNELPDPKCNHAFSKRTYYVSAGDMKGPGGFAAVWICGRDACLEDAKEWAFASTHQPVVVKTREQAARGTGRLPLDWTGVANDHA